MANVWYNKLYLCPYIYDDTYVQRLTSQSETIKRKQATRTPTHILRDTRNVNTNRNFNWSCCTMEYERLKCPNVMKYTL